MFFRDRQPEASIWRRFRTDRDRFSFAQDGEHYVAHVVASSERIVDLFHVFTEQLPPAVDVVVDDLGGQRAWRGEGVALPDVRDGMARLKAPLASLGGVEFSVYSSEDQLTLTPFLELFIYARTDRWLYLLQGKGLQEEADLPVRRWRARGFDPAPELMNALTLVAERLGLTPV